MKNKMIFRALTAVFLILICVCGCSAKSDIGFKVRDNYATENIDFEDNYNFYSEGYDFYKKLENDSGVFILNTAYYSDEILKIWKDNNVYSNVPKKAFWYYTVSPSYLRTMGIAVDEKMIQDAENGVRVFLIPDTYNDEEKNMMTDYLTEDSERALGENAPRKPEDAVKTVYYEKNEIEFASYTPAKEYFTYPCEQNVPLLEKAPIIFICTSNNMIYFESESLFATDVNSYIKFEDENTLKKYLDEDFVKKYNVKFGKLSNIYKKAERAGITDKGIAAAFG